MRAIAGAIIVVAGALVLICGALLPMLYLAHIGNTGPMPITPDLMIWIGVGTMVGGSVAVFQTHWKYPDQK
jgi:hypothetical protein